MVRVIGRMHASSADLAYKVMARGYAFEVSALGKRFHIRHLGGSKLPLQYLGAALNEVRKFLEVRGAALAA